MNSPENFSPNTIAHLNDAAFWVQFRNSAAEVESRLLLLRDQIGQNVQIREGIFAQPGRITRGQNYHGFPYRVLDHPAYFESGGFILFRTILIWGHHVSFHLIAHGEWKNILQQRLASLPDALKPWLFSMDNNPWEWFPAESGAIAFNALTDRQLSDRLQAADFIKFSRYHPIENGLNLVDSGHQYWRLWAPWVAGTDES